MEALVLLIAVLVSSVLIEAGYQIALGIVRWTPLVLTGGAIILASARLETDAMTALGTGLLACVALKLISHARKN